MNHESKKYDYDALTPLVRPPEPHTSIEPTNYTFDFSFSLVIAIARGSSLNELSYMGLVGIMDPPREGARPSVTTLQSTGVRVKMMTGDAQETACAIAQAVGLQVRW